MGNNAEQNKTTYTPNGDDLNLLRSIEKKIEADARRYAYGYFQKKYVGKYFKERMISNKNKIVWRYIKVLEIKPEDIILTSDHYVRASFTALAFYELPNEKSIHIHSQYTGYVDYLRKIIKRQEFDAEYKRLISKLRKYETA